MTGEIISGCPGDFSGIRILHRVSVNVMLEARHFFLWEGRFIGEATVVESRQGPSLSAEN
jgi:hypothetical protein